ncbi:ThiF family adenylyltransferase [Streptacidiphilus griseoplanus]|uniref:ThiF family adenylyltransferase n=1 Tax=Peterkaempfera griseoplana TaxID=66896 RepID=UPI0007C6FC70|nr:ThiF family adenylyltransferase [Peterkaempfera griseoplana]
MLRPMLKPALPRTWREREVLQFGAVAERAVVLDGVAPAMSAFLDLVDGSRETEELVAEGERLGVGADPTRQLLRSLAEAGLLDDAGAQQTLERLPAAERGRLSPDLASLSLVHPEPGAAPALLEARARASVQVRGAGRVGASVAALLAAAGVGSVEVVDRGRVTAGDCSPAGVPARDVGRLRTSAAREAVQRASGEGGGGAPAGAPGPGRPHLVVLAPRDGSAGLAADPAQGQQLMRAGIPHLHAGVAEHLGVVGPLVLPGASACGGCVALHRGDRDPAWARLLAQLCTDGAARARTPACDTALATAVAGLASLHVLMLLDGVRPPSVDGLLEVSAADGMARRLRMKLHPDCGCGWYGDEGAAGGPPAQNRWSGPAPRAGSSGSGETGRHNGGGNRLPATTRGSGGRAPGRPV